MAQGHMKGAFHALAKNNLRQHCADIGCHLEEKPEAMGNSDVELESGKISNGCAPYSWGINILYIYISKSFYTHTHTSHT